MCVYIHIHTEFAWLSGFLQCKILATPLPMPTYVQTFALHVQETEDTNTFTAATGSTGDKTIVQVSSLFVLIFMKR